jgi:hypothetical protein
MHVHAEALLAVPPSHKEFLKACVLTYETKMLFLSCWNLAWRRVA